MQPPYKRQRRRRRHDPPQGSKVQSSAVQRKKRKPQRTNFRGACWLHEIRDQLADWTIDCPPSHGGVWIGAFFEKKLEGPATCWYVERSRPARIGIEGEYLCRLRIINQRQVWAEREITIINPHFIHPSTDQRMTFDNNSLRLSCLAGLSQAVRPCPCTDKNYCNFLSFPWLIVWFSLGHSNWRGRDGTGWDRHSYIMATFDHSTGKINSKETKTGELICSRQSAILLINKRLCLHYRGSVCCLRRLLIDRQSIDWNEMMMMTTMMVG